MQRLITGSGGKQPALCPDGCLTSTADTSQNGAVGARQSLNMVAGRMGQGWMEWGGDRAGKGVDQAWEGERFSSGGAGQIADPILGLIHLHSSLQTCTSN